MLQLKLFGNPIIERDGHALTGRAAQRHRLALLALLAQTPGGRLSRDKLLAYLWPERDPEAARNLLKVSTYVIRETLGDDALLTVGDELRLNLDVVHTDGAEFEAALASRDYARATSLYHGPFLDGFFLNDAPEFEHWVDHERERLRRAFCQALEALAAAAEQTAEWARAVEWWKLRAAQDRYDSRVALRLMQALETSGNRAGALQHAAVHQHLLEAEFGVGLTPEISSFVERLRHEPAPAAPVRRASEVVPPPAPPEISTMSAPPRRRALAVAALAVLALVAAAFWAWPGAAADDDNSIVVLPFTNLSPEQDVEYFSDGLTEEIITRLASVPGLKVISRTSAMHYKGSQEPLPVIAEALDVAHVLEGSVRHDNGRVRISAQLIDARGDDHVWAENYEYPLHDSFRVQEEIAQEVARALEVKLSEGARKQLAKRGTSDAQAYELYQRGRFVWNTRTREGHQQAIEYFQRAIARDPGFANAYAGLADTYMTGFQLSLLELTEAEAYTRVQQAAERALALDDESADAHTSFAIALWWQRNWPGTERELRRALELNPGHASARTWYTLLLGGMGRMSDAFRSSRAALEADPFGLVILSNHGWLCYLAREYDCAIDYYRRSVEVSPWPQGFRGQAIIYAQMGRLADAERMMRKAVSVAPQRSDFLADLAFVLAKAGKIEAAVQTLENAKTRPIEPFSIGRAYAALGQRDSAFAWLERANWRWPHRAVRSDPALDVLRADRRFAQLSARVDREMGLQ